MSTLEPDAATPRRPPAGVRSCSVLGMRVDELDYRRTIEMVLGWAAERASRTMCISTVHMVMESFDDPGFQAVVNAADLVGADGMPIIWSSRRLGIPDQSRVFAPELTDRLCAAAAAAGVPVGFYGSSPAVLGDLVARLSARHRDLRVAYSYSPPFRPLTPEEDAEIVRQIDRSGARILFVGLGCPKQERWMSAHRGRVPAPMLGVGWAFDVLAGHSHAAPGWIQRAGLEWLYRLILNPRKLWRRHLRNNPRFLVLIALQLAGLRRFPLAGGR